MKLAILLANALGFPLLQLGVAWVFVRLPDAWFSSATANNVSPREARFYRNVLRVRSWKRHLPSGGQWMGSTFDHRAALQQGSEGRRRFVLETRRSEAAHWTSMLGSTLFLLWNPLWACITMLLAGVLFNAPCLLVQRYNRAALQSIDEPASR